MACFLVPAAEAVVVTAAYFVAKKKEQKIEAPHLADGESAETKQAKITWSKRLSWLMGLLWGGVALLAFEHLWHGEVVPFPPFLTAMGSPENTSQMLHEMSTVGVTMAAFVTGVWGIICALAQAKLKSVNAKLNKETA